MEKQHQYKLIEGVFSPAEAQKILFTLIHNKISFHNVEAFSTTVRFQGDTSHSETRVQQLLDVKSLLSDQLALADDLQVKVKVDGYFEVTFLK